MVKYGAQFPYKYGDPGNKCMAAYGGLAVPRLSSGASAKLVAISLTAMTTVRGGGEDG